MAVEWTFERGLTATDAGRVVTPPSGTRIRAIRPGDAPSLHVVYLDAFSTRTDAPLDGATWNPKWPLHELCVQDCSFVAVTGDRPVAYLLGYVDPDGDPHEGWIGQVGVRVAHREAGVATALILTALRAFARRGLTRAALSVAPDNGNAIRLYEALGFHRSPAARPGD